MLCWLGYLEFFLSDNRRRKKTSRQLFESIVTIFFGIQCNKTKLNALVTNIFIAGVNSILFCRSWLSWQIYTKSWDQRELFWNKAKDWSVELNLKPRQVMDQVHHEQEVSALTRKHRLVEWSLSNRFVDVDNETNSLMKNKLICYLTKRTKLISVVVMIGNRFRPLFYSNRYLAHRHSMKRRKWWIKQTIR